MYLSNLHNNLFITLSFFLEKCYIHNIFIIFLQQIKYRACLRSAYFTETENYLLKIL